VLLPLYKEQLNLHLESHGQFSSSVFGKDKPKVELKVTGTMDDTYKERPKECGSFSVAVLE